MILFTTNIINLIFQGNVITGFSLTLEIDGVENSTSYNVSAQFKSISGLYGLPSVVQYAVPAMGCLFISILIF